MFGKRSEINSLISRQGQLPQAMSGGRVKSISSLVKYDSTGLPTLRVGKVVLDRHPVRFVGVGPRPDENHGSISSHPVLDVTLVTGVVERLGICGSQALSCRLTLHEDDGVVDLSRCGVTDLQVTVDSGLKGATWVPQITHLQ